MLQINILDNKKDLLQLINLIETGEESSIVISKDEKPIATLSSYNNKIDTSKRIGIAQGKLQYPENFDEANEEILKLFE